MVQSHRGWQKLPSFPCIVASASRKIFVRLRQLPKEKCDANDCPEEPKPPRLTLLVSVVLGELEPLP